MDLKLEEKSNEISQRNAVIYIVSIEYNGTSEVGLHNGEVPIFRTGKRMNFVIE